MVSADSKWRRPNLVWLRLSLRAKCRRILGPFDQKWNDGNHIRDCFLKIGPSLDQFWTTQRKHVFVDQLWNALLGTFWGRCRTTKPEVWRGVARIRPYSESEGRIGTHIHATGAIWRGLSCRVYTHTVVQSSTWELDGMQDKGGTLPVRLSARGLIAKSRAASTRWRAALIKSGPGSASF